jgi:predicted SprT family Zn-dependent metalloprotease
MSETGGKPLPAHIKAKVERAFGQDFSNVRCHTNSHRPNAVGAKAFAHGDRIYFGPGQYNPSTSEGLELIAHELAHVVQQHKFDHITPTIQGRCQAKPAVEKMVKDFKHKS